ncbi:AAA family ATPase, partial [Streptomyces sp. NPDC050619]
DFSTEKPIEAALALRRGIGFGSGINVILGGNGSGKTILLQALAVQVGAVSPDDIKRFRYSPQIVLQLARNLDLLWHQKPSAEECFYLNPESPERWRFARLEEALSEEKNYRLFLLDEPMGAFDTGMVHQLSGRINELAQQGCQFIIATTDIKRIKFTDGQFIRIGRRRIRERGSFLSW